MGTPAHHFCHHLPFFPLQDAARAKIEAVRNHSSSFREERQAARANLNAVRSERDSVSKERNALIAQQKAMNESLKAIKSQAESLKAGVKFKSIQDVDREIGRLEQRQMRESLSLKDEKDLIKQIGLYKSMRKTLEQYESKLAETQKGSDTRSSLRAKIDEKSRELDEVKARFTKQREALAAVDAKSGSQGAAMPKLKKERDEANAKIDAAIAKKREFLSKWRADEAEWRKQQDAIRKQRDEQRRKENEEWEKEQEARRKEREAEELKKKPWEEEIALCDYLVAYVEKLVPKDVSATDAAASATSPTGRPSLDLSLIHI